MLDQRFETDRASHTFEDFKPDLIMFGRLEIGQHIIRHLRRHERTATAFKESDPAYERVSLMRARRLGP